MVLVKSRKTVKAPATVFNKLLEVLSKPMEKEKQLFSYKRGFDQPIFVKELSDNF